MRLDRALVDRKLASSRSQATDSIRRGVVELNNKIVHKPNTITSVSDKISVIENNQYVSRAARKLASISSEFQLNFQDTTILDVGSSTGGFTDYALQHGAKSVVAVDVGTDQLHPKIRANSKVLSLEKTDIRDYKKPDKINFDIVLVDVSFISVRDIMPTLKQLSAEKTQLVIMVKPQFETGKKHKGIVKNNTIRRQVLSEVESSFSPSFKVLNKKDSEISGVKGNVERFFLLAPAKR